MISGRYGKPALIGGAAMGVLSAIPFVNMGNCICCMYVWAGSVLAAYLLFKEDAGGTLGDGALVGLFSGVCGAVVSLVVSLPFTLFMSLTGRQFDPTESMPPEVLESMPPFLLDMMSGSGSAGFMLAAIVAGFFVNLALFALIGTLGGLIGAAIFRKKQDQPAQWTDQQPPLM